MRRGGTTPRPSAKALIKHFQKLLDLHSIWHPLARCQQARQELPGLLHRGLGHAVAQVERDIPSQPSRHLTLDLVQEHTEAMLLSLIRQNTDVDTIQQCLD